MFLLPGYGPRSSRATRRPARARVSAVADPAGPAPTTTTSKSGPGLSDIGVHLQPRGERGEQLPDVADECQLRPAHHGAAGVDVGGDDVTGVADTREVLHRA